MSAQRGKSVSNPLEVCEVCGHPSEGHQDPSPGPPDPPIEGQLPSARAHRFRSSGLAVPELLDERDAQIRHWRERAYRAEHKIKDARKALER